VLRLPAEYLFVAVDVAVMVLVDVHDPAQLQAAAGRALASIRALAYVDSIPELDRLAARNLQCLGKQARVIGKLLRGDPIAIGSRGGRKQHAKDGQRQNQLDQRETLFQRVSAAVPNDRIRCRPLHAAPAGPALSSMLRR